MANPYASPSAVGRSFPSASSGVPTKVRYGVLFFAVAMAVTMYLHRFALSTAQPAILKQFGIDKDAMGWAVGAFFWAYALMQVPAGYLADKLGGRRVLVACVIGWSVAMFGFAHADLFAPASVFAPADWGVWPLVLAFAFWRAVMGVMQAAAYPTAAGLLRQWMPVTSRGSASGAVSMGGRVGGLVAMLLTPLMMTAAGSLLGWSQGTWRVAFLIYAGVSLAWAVSFWWFFRDTPAEHPWCNDAERDLIAGGPATTATTAAESKASAQEAEQKGSPPRAASSKEPFPIVAFLTNRNVYLTSAISFCVNLGWIFLVTWMPTYLEAVHKTKLTSAGLLTAITGLCGVLGCVTGGFATDYFLRVHGPVWGRRLPGLLSAAGGVGLYLICLVVNDLYLQVALFAAIYFAVDFYLGSLWATFQDIGGRYTATVLGFANMCGNLGAAIFSTSIGYLAKNEQWNAMFIISAAAFAICMACWLFVDPRKKVA